MIKYMFTFRSRGFATGITAALNYAMTFVTTKTYYNLEISLGLYGVIWFYGFCDILGFFFIYFMLPETENRTLEDIETHFSDNKRKLTSIKIKKSKSAPAELDHQIDKNAAPTTNGVYTIKDGCDNRAYIGES